MNDNIILYHTSTCPVCKMIERLLKQYNIAYTSVMDVDEMIKLGINHPPVLSVNGELLRTPQEINNYINSRRG